MSFAMKNPVAFLVFPLYIETLRGAFSNQIRMFVDRAQGYLNFKKKNNENLE